VICGDLVIMVYDNQEDRYIAAFDARSGEQRWRTPRPGQTDLGTRSTWATPLVWKNDLRTEIVTSDYRCIRSYDLNGKMLWKLDGPTSDLVIPSPIAGHGMVYVTSGFVANRHLGPAWANRR
jgi:outer membrane protein assembly factor BamB